MLLREIILEPAFVNTRSITVRLILGLACKSNTGSRIVGEQLEYVKLHYSNELKEVLAYMLTKGANIEGLASVLPARYLLNVST